LSPETCEFNYLPPIIKEGGSFVNTINIGTSISNTFEEFVDYLQNGLMFSPTETSSFLSVLKGIIFLGEIKFFDEQNEHFDTSVNAMIHRCSQFFEINYESLTSFLMEKSIIVNKSEKIISRRSSRDSYYLRDSFASELYSSLFSWIVSCINENLQLAIAPEEDGKERKETNLSIALLDIFGFESLKENSIEQLLINYANEKLHYYFISVSILKEQELYTNEGIPFENIFSFSRVKDVLTSIEGSRGLIDIMRDQISLQQNDSYLYNQIKQSQQQSYLKGIKVDRYSTSKFIISHFAGEVIYSIDGIVDHNQDSSSSYGNNAFIDLLEHSSNIIIQKIYRFLLSRRSSSYSTASLKTNGSSASSNIRSSSVAKRFRGELEEIIDSVEKTELSFVKCIKPNEEKAPFLFNSSVVYDQLICNGILEVCQIKRAIYPYQMKSADFYSIYHWLSPMKGSFQNGSDSKEMISQFIQSIVDNCDVAESGFAIGISRIFLSNQIANNLERKLEIFIKLVVKVQSNIRRFLEQKAFRMIKKKILHARMLIILDFRRYHLQKRVYCRQMISARSLIVSAFRKWNLHRRTKVRSFLNKVMRLLLILAIKVWRNKTTALCEQEMLVSVLVVDEILEVMIITMIQNGATMEATLYNRNVNSEMELKYPKLKIIKIDEKCQSFSKEWNFQPSNYDILVETFVFVLIFVIFLFFC
jgi:myosin heavy subunit